MKRQVIWQDIVLMIGNFIFAPSLLTSIVDGIKIPIATSLPTALVLTAFIIVNVSLGLRLAALATTLTTACWFVLFIMAI